MVRMFTHSMMGCQINPSWLAHCAISRSSHCSMTGVTKAMCYPVCGMMHIKEPLLLIQKSSPYVDSGFPLSLSEWSFIICPTPYNRKIKCVECIIKSNISFLPLLINKFEQMS